MISVLKYSFLLIFIGLTGCSSSPQKSHQAPPLEIVDPVVPPKENKQPKKTKSVVVQAQTVAQEHKKTYLPTGKLAYITTYKNNVKVSKESFTYYKTGELSIQSKSIQGLKHGLVKHYSKNGNIWRTEQYQKGKKHGFSISYYTPVIIAKKLHFNNGLSDGVQEAFLPNGKRSDKWLYEQGKLLSHFKFQYFESGNLQFQHTYRNNQKNGLSNEYSEDGVLLSSSNFKNNLHHGKTLQFYETGKIKVEQRFRDNKEHGGSSGYYPLGELQWQGYYKNGLREGLYKEYYQHGQLKKQITYLNDKQNGPKRFFHENGFLKYELTMKNSKADGLLKEFDDKGNLKLTRNYNNGKITKENNSFTNGYLLWLSDNEVDKLIN